MPFNDPDQPVPLDVVLTNRQFILPRCDTLTFTAASLRLLTTSKCSCFFDNRLTPPSRYKRECSNKLVLLNMDCRFFYFDELVTYYAVSCSVSLWNLTRWSCDGVTPDVLLLTCADVKVDQSKSNDVHNYPGYEYDIAESLLFVWLFSPWPAHFLMFTANQLQEKDHIQRGIFCITHTFWDFAPSYIFHNQHKTLNNLYLERRTTWPRSLAVIVSGYEARGPGSIPVCAHIFSVFFFLS